MSVALWFPDFSWEWAGGHELKSPQLSGGLADSSFSQGRAMGGGSEGGSSRPFFEGVLVQELGQGDNFLKVASPGGKQGVSRGEGGEAWPC